MVDDTTHARLRRAAALVHAIPGARLTISTDERDVVVVGERVSPEPGVVGCSPCRFRSAVAHAHARHISGRAVSLRGLPAGTHLDLTLHPGDAGHLIDGDLVQTRISDRWIALTATTLSPIDASAAVLDAGLDARSLRIHHDDRLEVTLIHIDLRRNDAAMAADLLADLGRARTACAVHELIGQMPTTDVRR
ncbi:MAG: hypothetical protein JJE52_09290 [Acidimicrobiia bacterium]|nr:hypothetical protein [Acidimicrobiia bacterium]